VLELARRLALRRADLRRRIVFVAFGAEELGTLGSAYFVKNPPVPFDGIVAMANMDMIGRLRDGALDVHGVGTSPVWGPLVEETNRGAGLQLKLHEGGYGPSDHSPFYAAGKPVLFVFTGVHRDYHRPSDTAEKIDAQGIDKVLSLVEPVVWALASGRTAEVPFVRVAADKEQQSASGARGFRVWLGGIPDYSAEVKGVQLSGVSPGSPAEKAGLKGGDILVKLGEKEIRNIYDYTYALGAHKPGDRVVAVVRREGKDVEAELVLAARPSAAR
jgi:Zn-dependent M28 family amino/carboxypeptidase